MENPECQYYYTVKTTRDEIIGACDYPGCADYLDYDPCKLENCPIWMTNTQTEAPLKT